MSGGTRGSPPAGSGPGWTETVAEATRHVDARREAEAVASERQKPRTSRARLVATLAALVAVVAWNVVRWTAAVDPLPVAQERMNLAWMVVDVVESIEDFRAEQGRLPNAIEVAQTADEDVEYALTDGGYRVTVHGDGGSISYDGGGDVDQWMATQDLAATEEATP